MQSFSRVNYFGHYILFPPIPSLLSNQCLLAHKGRILYIKRLYYNNESRRPSGWGGVGWDGWGRSASLTTYE